jgi:transcriptional regulator with XRE-family HTH domain
MAARVRTHSRATVEALKLLGAQIRLARKQRGLTEAGLAERVGIARSTLQAIEKGEPGVEIGLAFEAATLVGVPLFEPEGATLAPHIARIEDTLTLLPRSVRPRREVKDDF